MRRFPPSNGASSARKLGLLPLVAATYLMVAGGPFGLEDIVSKAGYTGTLLILVVTPLLWSIPTALMVAELSSAIPEEGGFYIWVRRGMGPFWGFQETWLSLAGSVFEMALYPTLFVEYLGRFAPSLAQGSRPLWIGVAMIALCTLWNIAGTRAVGEGSTLLTLALLAPFAVLAVVALAHGHSAGTAVSPLRRTDIMGGILIAMWNYMGWDNTSTIAGEVARPQRTYPRAMALAVTLVAVSYLLPVAAASRTGLDPNSWTTGGWVDVARSLSGNWLAGAITAAGMLGAIGTFLALMLSFSRLPMVMAEDGFLPKVFTRLHRRTRVPWVAIVACAVAWAASLTLGFERLVLMDVLLTGLSILLEFCALVALRIREPDLVRPYRVPGGVVGAILLGVAPAALMVIALVRNRTEQLGSTSALSLGIVIILAGGALYFVPSALRALTARNKA